MIPDRDFCPRGNKTFGDRAAKPLGAAGDHRVAVVEIDFVHRENPFTSILSSLARRRKSTPSPRSSRGEGWGEGLSPAGKCFRRGNIVPCPSPASFPSNLSPRKTGERLNSNPPAPIDPISNPPPQPPFIT